MTLSNDAQDALDALSGGLVDECANLPRHVVEAYARGEDPNHENVAQWLDELLCTVPASHERPRWYSYLDPDGGDATNPELEALRFAGRIEAAQFCLEHCLYNDRGW